MYVNHRNAEYRLVQLVFNAQKKHTGTYCTERTLTKFNRYARYQTLKHLPLCNKQLSHDLNLRLLYNSSYPACLSLFYIKSMGLGDADPIFFLVFSCIIKPTNLYKTPCPGNRPTSRKVSHPSWVLASRLATTTQHAFMGVPPVEIQKTNRFYVFCLSGTSSAVLWPQRTAPTSKKQRAVEVEAIPEKRKHKEAPTAPKSEVSKLHMSPSARAGNDLSTEDIEHSLLDALSSGSNAEIVDTWGLAESLGCPHNDLVGVLISLEAEDMLKSQLLQTMYFVVSDEGQGVIENGSPEMRVLEFVPEGSEGVSKTSLEAALGANLVKIGLGQCMKNKWVLKGKDGSIVRGDNADGSVKDNVRELLKKVASGEILSDQQAKDLKRRKLITQVTRKSFKVKRGPAYAPRRVRRQAELTKEMLANGSWKDSAFKEYNFKALGVPCGGGNLHPLLKVRAEFRKILMFMGFEEMPTNRWVETSFWNFDSLFQPQSHPARDAHDTFFIKDPASALSFPEDYLEVVKDTHETGGGFGSVGYGCQWKREEASKNLLRTHTTAISSQMLYRLANQKGGFTPKRYFSIDRVFRNETMDATHLCEFHQVEGLVADRNLCLGDLIGVIKTFFHKIGITQIRFKPAYNPYTEPSMEVFGYHPDLKKWTEIGNSGMFRPEMLLPMGLPKDVRVIAWGLSLERPTMIKYGITNIRELFGHKADLNRTKTAPVCRFE